MCKLHHQWNLYWTAVKAKWTDWSHAKCHPNPNNKNYCEGCFGTYQFPEYGDLFDYAVCKFSHDDPVTVATLAANFPKAECIDGTCPRCTETYQIVPPCYEVMHSTRKIDYEKYGYQNEATKEGGVFRKTGLTQESLPLNIFSTHLNERLPEILTHHFYTKWLKAQLPYLEANVPSGVAVLRMDFQERVGLFSKTNVAQEEYFKVKVVLFLVASAMRFGPNQPVQDDLCIYMCPNSVQKNAALVQHCVKDTMKWLRSRAGLSSVFYVSDRARQEFSNCTALHALSEHDKRHGTRAHHVFEVEGEGKGPVDGLGAAIKRLIRNICSRYPHTPTLFELYTELTRITKSAPIRGPKYRKYKQYRFVLVQPDEISTLTPGDTIPATTKFYQYASTGTPGELSRRRMPCFCDCCMRGAYHRCPNAAFCGPWEKVRSKKQ